MNLIVDITDIEIPNINNHYGKISLRPGMKRPHRYNTKQYSDFKNLISLHAKKNIDGYYYDPNSKYEVVIEIWTYLDIDNAIKPVLDAIFRPGVIDADDRNVVSLEIYKHPMKRGAPGRLLVYVNEILP